MALAEGGLHHLLERARALGSVEPHHDLLPFCIAKSRHRCKMSAQKWDVSRPMVSWVRSWRKLVEACGIRAGCESQNSLGAISASGTSNAHSGPSFSVRFTLALRIFFHQSGIEWFKAFGYKCRVRHSDPTTDRNLPASESRAYDHAHQRLASWAS
jgi:hypothetical protein